MIPSWLTDAKRTPSRVYIAVVAELTAPAHALCALRRHSRGGSEGPRRVPEQIDRFLLDEVIAEADPVSGILPEPEARQLVGLAGIDTGRFEVVHSAEACGQAATGLGGDVALKLVACGIVHKSDVGGVILDIRGEGAACDGFKSLTRGRPGAAVLIAPMVRGGLEVVIGGIRDPHFGPVVMAGIGGVWVEVLNDICFDIAPLSKSDALALLDRLAGAKLLGAHRGRGALDSDALADVIVKLGDLLVQDERIRELELNPVVVLEHGVIPLDAHACVTTNERLEQQP